MSSLDETIKRDLEKMFKEASKTAEEIVKTRGVLRLWATLRCYTCIGRIRKTIWCAISRI